MLGAVLLWLTVATSDSGMVPCTPASGNARSAARSPGAPPARTTTVCATPPMVRVPAVLPRSAAAPGWPTCASVSPACAALRRSTATATVGWAAARLLRTSVAPGMDATACCTAAAACASTTGSAARTDTCSASLPNPLCAVSRPTWSGVPSAARRRRRSSRAAVTSVFASRVTENRVLALVWPGAPNPAGPPAPDPTVTW